MPGPLVFVGASFIGALLSRLFASLVEVAGKYMRKKFAVRVVFWGIVIAMLGGFVISIQALLVGLPYVLPSEYTSLLVQILPANTSVCLSTIITATIARRIYDLNVQLAKHTWLGI